MKIFNVVLFFCFTATCFAQTDFDAELTSLDSNYYFEKSAPVNTALLIFLHGGVSNPYFKQPPSEVELAYLLENNVAFYQQVENNGYDLIAPITNSDLNWLESPEKTFLFLKRVIESKGKQYDKIIISGHSDGATASYKMFYKNLEFFNGLVLINGYPQHSNFYLSTKYESVTDKDIVFYGTLNDEVIPYEFLLTEYCKQKKSNPNTYLYLIEGDHNFSNYSNDDFAQLFSILNGQTVNKKTAANPIHGFVKEDQLVEFYPFRKKIVRKFAYGEHFFHENKKQRKKHQ